SRVPINYVPVLAKALNKNPVQRYASMTEMARAVEEVARGKAPAVPNADPGSAEQAVAHMPPRPVPPARPVLPVEASAPTGPSVAVNAIGELCGSMVLATVFAALATALWAALAQARSIADLGTVFFLTVSASWAVLVPTKFWTRPMEDSWARRVVMLLLG